MTNTRPELLPCPFCGEPAEYIREGSNLVCCWGKNENCGHRGLVMKVEKWNTRATPTTAQGFEEWAKENKWNTDKDSYGQFISLNTHILSDCFTAGHAAGVASVKPVEAGDIIPRPNTLFGDLVAVPVEQMNDIYETLCKIVAMSQYNIPEISDKDRFEFLKYKGDVFCEAESAQLIAGNWAQRNTTESSTK